MFAESNCSSFELKLRLLARVIGVDSFQVIDEGLFYRRTTQLSFHRGG